MVRHCKYEDRVEIHDPFLPRKPFTNSPIRGIIIRALFQKNNNGGGCKMKLIKTVDAEGAVLCHDITQIIKGVTKDAVFRKGHIVAKEDIGLAGKFIRKEPKTKFCRLSVPRC